MKCRGYIKGYAKKIYNWKPINRLRTKAHDLYHIRVTDVEMMGINAFGKAANAMDFIGNKLKIEDLSDKVFDRVIRFLERFEKEEKND